MLHLLIFNYKIAAFMYMGNTFVWLISNDGVCCAPFRSISDIICLEIIACIQKVFSIPTSIYPRVRVSQCGLKGEYEADLSHWRKSSHSFILKLDDKA